MAKSKSNGVVVVFSVLGLLACVAAVCYLYLAPGREPQLARTQPQAKPSAEPETIEESGDVASPAASLDPDLQALVDQVPPKPLGMWAVAPLTEEIFGFFLGERLRDAIERIGSEHFEVGTLREDPLRESTINHTPDGGGYGYATLTIVGGRILDLHIKGLQNETYEAVVAALEQRFGKMRQGRFRLRHDFPRRIFVGSQGVIVDLSPWSKSSIRFTTEALEDAWGDHLAALRDARDQEQARAAVEAVLGPNGKMESPAVAEEEADTTEQKVIGVGYFRLTDGAVSLGSTVTAFKTLRRREGVQLSRSRPVDVLRIEPHPEVPNDPDYDQVLVRQGGAQGWVSRMQFLRIKER